MAGEPAPRCCGVSACRTTCWPSSLWNFLTLESAMLRDSLLPPVSGVTRPEVDAAAAACAGGGGSGPGSVGLVPPPAPLDGFRAPSAAGVSAGSVTAPAVPGPCGGVHFHWCVCSVGNEPVDTDHRA